MSHCSSRDPGYKRLRCRCFDDKGTSISRCKATSPDLCRFIHPTDPQWKEYKGRKDKEARGAGSSEREGSQRRHTSPLISQADLFEKRCKEEANGEDLLSMVHSPPRGPRVRRPYEDRSCFGVSPAVTRVTRFSTRDDFQSNESNTALIAAAAPMLDLQSKASEQPENAPNAIDSVHKLTDLFRQLAKVASHIAHETAAHELHEKKLRTYHEITMCLSKISPLAVTAVAPTLTSILENHNQSEKRVENSYIALGGIWENIFTVFHTEINTAVEAAIGTIRGEQDVAIGRIQAPSHVQRVSSIASSRSSSVAAAERSTSHKRTRSTDLDASDARGDSVPPPSKRHRRPTFEGIQLDPSLQDILQKIKEKVDRQARSLEPLSKENNELKSSMRNHHDTDLPTAHNAATVCSPFPATRLAELQVALKSLPRS